MKKEQICNKKNAIIITVVMSLLVGTVINAQSWYALLDNGSVNEKVIVKSEEDVVEDIAEENEYIVEDDEYTVYDENYNIVSSDSTLQNLANLGTLGMENASVQTLESNGEDVEVQSVKSVKTVKRKAMKVASVQLKYLACLINAEARGESYKGKLAVANVVINRVRSKKYPNTIKKVIMQKSQFGPARNGSLNRELKNYAKGTYKKNKAAKASLKAAKEALKGYNNIGGRFFFNGKRYSKARKNNVIIGNHRFW